jgi:hypothetical protein
MKQKVFFILALLLFGVTQGVVAQTHVSKLKTRTVDAEKWTISPNPAEEGQTVTATYTGRKKVMSVQAEKNPYTDLSMVDCAGNERQSQWTANCYMVHTAGKYRLPLVYGNAIKNGEANTSAYTGTDDIVYGTHNILRTKTFPNHEGNAINAPWITKSTDGEGADQGMGISVASAELLWQDAQGLVTEVGIKGDYLTLTVGKNATEQEGNAVVAAKTADGTIVWSWHIWVTRQTFAAADLTTIDTGSLTYTLTPVNVGWVGDVESQGYSPYYQWGRKDAFIPADLTKLTTEGGETVGGGGGGGMGNEGFQKPTIIYAADHVVYDIDNNEVTALDSVDHTESNVTIADNIKNPTTLYSSEEKGPGDNYFQPLRSPNDTPYLNMWDAQQPVTFFDANSQETATNIAKATVKTVYDPCPAGFCVPTDHLFEYFKELGINAFTTVENIRGRKLSVGERSVFFPYLGYRSRSSGRVVEVDKGEYFSATAVGPKKYRAFFYRGIALYFTYMTNQTVYNAVTTTWNPFATALPVRAVAEE